MKRIFVIASKDLLEMLRDRKTFLFLLVMPIAFTVLFGFAFGSFGPADKDTRPVIGYLDQDQTALSAELERMLAGSGAVRLAEDLPADQSVLEGQVAAKKLAALVVVPAGYSQSLLTSQPERLQLVAGSDPGSAIVAEGEVRAFSARLANAARSSQIVAEVSNVSYATALTHVLDGWQQPPLRIDLTHVETEQKSGGMIPMSHTSPAMMLQFAIAGLLTAAQVLVNERKSRSLQRMLTTAATHAQILGGHYLAIFALVFVQFVLLITFGQLVLGVEYLRHPLGTLVMAVTSAMCIAAIGLLVGTLAKSDDQAVIFSLIPMFVLSALGGAWMPLEFTSPAFRAVGHLSPVAWALDGFKNIAANGLGFASVLAPSAALLGYTALFFGLAVWRLRASEEK